MKRGSTSTLLPFDIVTIYEKHALTDKPPWHVKGGDWTFFDCTIGKRNPTTFTVGVSKSGPRAVWGEAVFVVTDRAMGTRFLKDLGKAFEHEPPRPRTPEPLTAWRFKTAILGQDVERNDDRSYSGYGDWQATKWFLEQDGCTAEVFFNFNLTERRGSSAKRTAIIGRTFSPFLRWFFATVPGASEFLRPDPVWRKSVRDLGRGVS